VPQVYGPRGLRSPSWMTRIGISPSPARRSPRGDAFALSGPEHLPYASDSELQDPRGFVAAVEAAPLRGDSTRYSPSGWYIQLTLAQG
jgi:hypothetical protein